MSQGEYEVEANTEAKASKSNQLNILALSQDEQSNSKGG